jgi:outer membrane scaffolding protein for murein synthesis (MipA/OmpV family)
MPISAIAQVTGDADRNSVLKATEFLDDAPGFDTIPRRKEGADWSFSLGIVTALTPDYEGSDDYGFSFAPDYKINWRDRVVLSGRTLRVFLHKEKIRLGTILALVGGRDGDDDLSGLGDVDGGAEGGLFLSYKMKPLTFKTQIRQEFAGGHDGALIDVGANVKFPVEKPLFTLGMEVTWASENYMDSFFSVNAVQSANSGLRTFKADAGFKKASISLASGYDITENWVLGGIVRYGRMLQDAADSPVVADVGDANQFFVGAGLSYQFSY